MMMTKKGYSAKKMQTILGHNRYKPIWLMMHKIRIMMGKRNERYTLDGFIELDEGFFAGHRKKGLNSKGKQVKEIDCIEKVLVAVNRNDNGARFLKMTVFDSLFKKNVAYVVQKMIHQSSTVITDGRRCYTPLEDLVQEHQVHFIKNKKEVCTTFPWVHIAISNAKKKIKGLLERFLIEQILTHFSDYAQRRRRSSTYIF